MLNPTRDYGTHVHREHIFLDLICRKKTFDVFLKIKAATGDQMNMQILRENLAVYVVKKCL